MLHIFASYPTFLVFVAIVVAIAVTMVLMPVWIRSLQNLAISASRCALTALKATW